VVIAGSWEYRRTREKKKTSDGGQYQLFGLAGSSSFLFFFPLFLFLRFPFSSVVLPAPTIVVFFLPFSYDFPFLRFPLRPKHNSVFLDVSMTPCQFDNLFIDFLAFLPFFFLPSLLFFLVLVLPRSVFLCSLSGFVLGLYGGRWITLGIE
jgi:hypothetical protein